MNYLEELKLKQARSNQLVNSALELHAKGHEFAKLCLFCKFTFPKILNNCPYCHNGLNENIRLTDIYTHKLASRYWQLGFADKSLKAIKTVDYMLDINDRGEM
ncbi:MAG: hypothetical protein ACTH36_02450 [Pseudoalteromonas nigrifaciens]|uniref:hypothetical protein n=1 Tax=Pseudoalteromonas undina TaxID=43660 RepID=UPI00186867C9|nr:hypothetical protein [Pseudoalteromonas undina]